MKTLSVFGSITQKIDVNPIDVINKLVEQAIDDDTYVVEKDGNYFLKYASRRGWGAATEISKELYEYVTSLQKVREYLTKHQN